MEQAVSLTRCWTLFSITKARTGTPGGVLDSDKKSAVRGTDKKQDDCDSVGGFGEVIGLAISSSIMAKLLLGPLVKWILGHEGKCCNTFAYFLIFLQVAVGKWLYRMGALFLL
jgi:hypothetical protein